MTNKMRTVDHVRYELGIGPHAAVITASRGIFQSQPTFFLALPIGVSVASVHECNIATNDKQKLKTHTQTATVGCLGLPWRSRMDCLGEVGWTDGGLRTVVKKSIYMYIRQLYCVTHTTSLRL